MRRPLLRRATPRAKKIAPSVLPPSPSEELLELARKVSEWSVQFRKKIEAELSAPRPSSSASSATSATSKDEPSLACATLTTALTEA